MSCVNVPLADKDTVERLLDYPSLIEAIRRAFIDPPNTPRRLSVPLAEAEGQRAGTLLVMPAVRSAGLVGVKIVTIHPSLSACPTGAVHATYIAMDAATGELRGLIDGHSLTVRRTAAASVLAAGKLARPDSKSLLVIGTGAIGQALAEAYALVLKPKRISIWSRRAEKAEAVAAGLRRTGADARAVQDLPAAVRSADIITAATLSQTPLVHGVDVRPGAHVDLVGGFTPQMREADDCLIAKARLIVDADNTIEEAGDIAQPLQSGLIDRSAIASLRDVLMREIAGRRKPEDITLFKSAGHALEDLAAAELLFQRWRIPGPERPV